jgi:hypothetical protein
VIERKDKSNRSKNLNLSLALHSTAIMFHIEAIRDNFFPTWQPVLLLHMCFYKQCGIYSHKSSLIMLSIGMGVRSGVCHTKLLIIQHAFGLSKQNKTGA